jgi:2',3'-cyclic-nucleotide 2'-phosphodiesterase (5'-nucleotidase family)
VNATGGFRRRATFIQQQAAEHDNLLVLDSGDALVGGGWLGDLTDGQAIVAGMNSMAYDAMALGPNELSLGQEKLGRRLGEARFPVLSANVVRSDTGELLVQPYHILEVGDHRLGVLGLTRLPAEPETGFRVLDPQEAAARYVPEISKVADTVIVLTNLDYRSGLALAEAVPEIDLLIAALPAQLPEAALRVSDTGTLVVTAEQASPRHSGRRVGRLLATLGPDGNLSGEEWQSVWMDGSIPDDPSMTDLVQQYRP